LKAGVGDVGDDAGTSFDDAGRHGQSDERAGRRVVTAVRAGLSRVGADHVQVAVVPPGERRTRPVPPQGSSDHPWSAPNLGNRIHPPDGKPLHPHSVSPAFERAQRGLAVSPMRFHDLRRTHASLLLRDRVPIKVVSEGIPTRRSR
jgi:integrase